MKRIAQLVTLMLLGFCVGTLLAQQPKPRPTVSAELQARFWKARRRCRLATTSFQQAQQKTTKAQGEFQAVIKELDDLCGKDYEPQMNAKGDPACVVKPRAEEMKPAQKMNRLFVREKCALYRRDEACSLVNCCRGGFLSELCGVLRQ